MLPNHMLLIQFAINDEEMIAAAFLEYLCLYEMKSPCYHSIALNILAVMCLCLCNICLEGNHPDRNKTQL